MKLWGFIIVISYGDILWVNPKGISNGAFLWRVQMDWTGLGCAWLGWAVLGWPGLAWDVMGFQSTVENPHRIFPIRNPHKKPS